MSFVLVGLFLSGLLSAQRVTAADEKTRELKLSSKFLLIPIGPELKTKPNGLQVVIDGKPVYQYARLRVAPKPEDILSIPARPRVEIRVAVIR